MAFGDGLKPKTPTCTACALLATLDTEERERAAALFADPQWSNVQLAAELTDNGFPCAREAVARHRKNHVPGWSERP